MSGSGTQESEKCSKWKDLPSDLLKAIAKRLTCNADYISFRAVCKCWRSAATFDNFDREFRRVPHLMYFVPETKEEERGSIFLDLVANTSKITNFPPATDYPYLSSSAWILRQSKHSLNLGLLHYIRRENIDLPRLDTLPGYQENSHLPIIRKMVLSTSPDFVIMVIWGDGGQLAFCRPRDESWSMMDAWDAPFSDIIYDDTKLYAVDSGLRIVECDIHGSNPNKLVQVFTFPRLLVLDSITPVGFVYLVKSSSGKFLIVCQYIFQDKTYGFRIFEIELKDGSCVEINNLGRRYLFLGLNSSICAEFPEWSNWIPKQNCIVFTNGIEQCRHPDTGMYILSDYEGILGFFVRFSFHFPQPIMVLPTL